MVDLLPLQRSGRHGVVGAAVGALEADHVVGGDGRGVAVAAERLHLAVPELGRHLRPADLRVHSRPLPLAVLDGNLALGAGADAVFDHLAEAVDVQQVTAGEHLAAGAGRVDVLQTDAAVGAAHAIHTLMVVLHMIRQTQVTVFAMEKIVPSTRTANATLSTMKLFLFFIVVQATYGTKIPAQLIMTMSAVLTHRLANIAVVALHLRHSEPVHHVILGLVMTEAAGVRPGAAGCHHFCFSAIMLTTLGYFCITIITSCITETTVNTTCTATPISFFCRKCTHSIALS